MSSFSRLTIRRSSLCDSSLACNNFNLKQKPFNNSRRSSIAEELYSSVSISETHLSSTRSSLDSGKLGTNNTINEEENKINTKLNNLHYHKLPFSPMFKKSNLFNMTKKMIKSILKNTDEKSDTRLSIDQVRQILSLKNMNYPQGFKLKQTLLGNGSFGKVYLVHRIIDGKKYAIKKIPIFDENGKDNYDKFVKEAIISTMIEDVSFRTTLDISKTEKEYILIMDYYPLTLSRLLFDGKASIGQLNHHYRQLIRLVKNFHDEGIAHRDLKLENICLALNGQVKLIDFGNAILFNPLESSFCTGTCGTNQFMAPEVLEGKPYDAKKSDIWSLGIIYILLTNSKLPWSLASNSSNSYNDYIFDRERFFDRFFNWSNSSLPKSTVLKMLDPNPINRISLEELLEHGFFFDKYL